MYKKKRQKYPIITAQKCNIVARQAKAIILSSYRGVYIFHIFQGTSATFYSKLAARLRMFVNTVTISSLYGQ